MTAGTLDAQVLQLAETHAREHTSFFHGIHGLSMKSMDCPWMISRNSTDFHRYYRFIRIYTVHTHTHVHRHMHTRAHRHACMLKHNDEGRQV
jgi:hypothetical protein